MRSKLLYSVAHAPMSFGKGGSQPPEPTRVSDNLRSQDTVEVLLGLGEGPWSKLHDGLKSFYIANTPLMASDGTLNFPEANLIFHKGTAMPDPVEFLLGGSASGHSVGVNLSQNSAVTRTTTSGDINAIDVRLRIDQLMLNTEDGDQLNEDLLFRIEVKPTSSGTWTSLPPNTGWLQSWTAPEEDDDASGIWASIRHRIIELQTEDALSEYEAEGQAWTEYQANADGPVDTSLGVQAYAENIRVYGRTQSPVMKEIRIPVVPLSNDTYDIRVTKISAESTSTSIREITWDTFEQITIEEKSYPNTVMAQLVVQASDQLSSVPQMYGVYDTAEILVPSIFDPVTRSYDFSGGPWDGTFKVAFTDDLAWIIYDLVHNDVHGIAAYHSINFSKYEALEASLYWNACDPVTGAYVGVPRPSGGTRPRVTFNGLIDSPRNSMELLTYMAGAGNAVFYEDVEGNFRLKVETDTPSTQTFNNMDVENGRFQYSFSDINTRYNDITVVYRNKKLPAYQEDRRRVYDQADIDANGRKPLTFVAVGCVDTDEAITRAYHKLITSLTETRNVAFTTTRMGAYVEPHDIILIADEAMDEGHSRRCMGTSADNTTLVYNEPLVLESGINDYVVRIQTADGIWESNVNETSNATTENKIRLVQPVPQELLDTLDPNFSFSIASATEGDLRPYRVTSIEEGDGDEKIKISAIEVNRSKYALVDNFEGEIFNVTDEPDESDSPSRLVTDLQATVTERATVDGKVNDINLSWEAPETTTAGAVYAVRYSLNDEEEYEITRGTNRSHILKNVAIGRHRFAVTTLQTDGSDSPETKRIRVTTVAPDYGLPSITGVTIQNKKDTATSYIGRNVSLEWSVDTSDQWEGWASDKPHPDFAWWEVDVVNPSNGSIVHTYQVSDWKTRKLEIPYSDFNTFGLTDIRDFSVVVSMSDAEGNEGGSVSKSIEKPAYALSGVTVVHPSEGSPRGSLKFTEPTDPDYNGVKVWVSDTTDAHTSGSLVWDGKGTPVLEFIDGTNYISYQVKDVFGTTGQPISTTTFNADVADVVDLIDFINQDIDDLETAAATAAQDILDLEATYGSTASAAASAQAAADSAQEAADDVIATAASASSAATAASDAVAARNESQTAQGLAETARDQAQAAETNASTASGVAVSTARSLLPKTMENAAEYFTNDINGLPDTLGDVTDAPNVTTTTDATEGAGLNITAGQIYIASKGWISTEVGRRYRISARLRENSGTAGNVYIYVRKMKADGTHDGATGQILTLQSGTNTYTTEKTIDQAAWDSGTRYIKPQILINHSGGDRDIDLFELSIEDITESYEAGNSASAAATSASTAGVSETNAGQSAAAAQSAETAAQTARSGAEVAETNAATSATNAAGSESAAANSATTAANSETAAGNSASAASTSASNAASEANDASQSATAAQGSQNSAATSASNALTSENNAATSETNAAGSASSAATSASNAATSEGNAGGSATAASNSASAAASSATDAGNSASAAASSSLEASTSRDSAERSAYLTLPYALSEPEMFSHNATGDNTPDLLSGTNWEAFTDATEGTGVRNISGQTGDRVAQKGYLPFVVGNTYRVSLKARETATPTDDRLQIRIWRLAGDFSSIGSQSSNPVFTPNTVQDFVYEYTATQAHYDAGVRILRASASVNLKPGGSNDGLWEVWQLKFEDITAQAQVEASASAASTSASNAAASETNAGSSASAASTAANTATTEAGNASTSAGQAATSATNAAGSASAAASSETVAANAASEAGADATAAANSASAASASETAAGQSATSASTSANTATTQAGNASTSASQAATSATNASGSASAAASSETVSANAADQALAIARNSLPSTFEDADAYWTHDLANSPSTAADVSLSSSFSLINDATEGAGLKGSGTGDFASTKGVIPFVVGDTYRITVRVRENTTPSNDIFALRFNYLRDDYSYYTRSQSTLTGLTSSVGEYVYERTMTQAHYDNGARWIRAGFAANTKSGGSNDGDWDVFMCKVENVSSEINAAASASASASSASAAAASESAAGTSATASQNSATSAASSASSASVSANNAATSATNAAGSASQASTSEGIAVSASSEARRASYRTRPTTFVDDGAYFTGTVYATPENCIDLPTSPTQLSSNSFGPYIRNKTTSDNDIIYAREAVPYLPNHTYRISATAGRIAGVNSPIVLRARHLTGDYATNQGLLSLTTGNINTQPNIYSFEFTATQAEYDTGTRLVKAGVELNSGLETVTAVYDLRIEDITAEHNSESSAAAAASSASAASASESAAGSFATSATTSANTATTQAGNASVSASSAATSASTATTAANAARAHLEVTAQATADAYVTNPNFVDYDLSTFPKGWGSWGTATVSKETTIAKTGNAVRIASTGTGNSGMRGYSYSLRSGGYAIDPDVIYNRYFVLSTWVYLESGDFGKSAVHLNLRHNNQSSSFGSRTLDLNAEEPNPVTGRWYHFQKFIDWGADLPNTVDGSLLYAMNNYDSAATTGTLGTKTLIWDSIIFRPATPAEIEVNAVLDISGTVTTMSSVLAELQGRVTAHWQVETGVSGFTGTFISARTTSAGGVVSSEVSFGAREIGLYNVVDGTWLQAMRVSGGDVRITGNLEAGAGIYLGSGAGRWPVALQDKIYNEDDGTVINFGLDVGDYEVDFSSLGLDDPASGETYRLRAINKSGTGFTTELKIIQPSGTASHTESTNATTPAGPDQMVAKAQTADAYNDIYSFYASGSVSVFVFSEGGGIYEYSSICFVNTWFHDGTSWVEGPQVTFSHHDVGINPTHTSGTQSYSFSNKKIGQVSYTGTIRDSASLGTFGLDDGGDFVISNLNSVQFSTQTQAGTRTATPNGETCKITVKPINIVS